MTSPNSKSIKAEDKILKDRELFWSSCICPLFLRIYHQNGIPLAEFLKDNAIGESLAADANSLKDSVATQLVQYKMWLQFSSLLTGVKGRMCEKRSHNRVCP